MEDKGFQEVLNQIQEPAQTEEVPVVDDNSLIDSVIFGTNNEEAFAQPQETPEVKPDVKPVPGAEDKLNESQYQYWQSQADKARNDNLQMKAELDKLKYDVQQKPVMPEPVKEPEIEEFPAPPEKPLQPQGFNMEEAYSDTSSDSAKYLQAKEQWRDDMYQYNTLKTDYVAEINKQYMDKMNNQQQQQREAYEMQARQKAVMDNVRQQVVAQYGADSKTVDNFITEMSKPEALSIENLWKLYNLNSGQQGPATPSPNFKQTQQTQYVPSPMGTMPSADVQANTRTPEDMIMDGMISEFEGKNPF